MSFSSVEQQLSVIKRGVEEIIPEQDLVEKLERSVKYGKPLLVKLGCDPSRPDLHIGHSVVLRKLRQFQDLGHNTVLIVGDFTAMIGDPSGKSKTRPALTFDEARAHGKSYFEQAGKILDVKRTIVRYNGDWLDKMSFSDVVRLASKYTVARMLERDEFEKRYRSGEPISVHEFLYPLAQAQDSVELGADIELGGTDQKFNLMVARDIQAASGLEPQVCITLPILEGTDGVEKMSKSLGNYIGITDAPEDIYGKTLSISDELIYRYYLLATDASAGELERIKTFAKDHPRDAKHELAHTLVRMYHGKQAANAARKHFETVFVKKENPDDIPDFTPQTDAGAEIGLLDLIRQAGFAKSNGEARRLVKQNAVSIDGDKITDHTMRVDLSGAPMVLKVGKRRIARIVRH